MNSDFIFAYKTPAQLSEVDKESIFHLAVKEFPSLNSYFEKNKYYSSVKPAYVLLVYYKEKIIAFGKLVKKIVRLSNTNLISFFAFGLVVDSAFQRKGIGSVMIERHIQKGKKTASRYDSLLND